jgi:diguanylate cyclase (GGDEF)-like protein/PAS domain S-box-containing protein
MSGMHTDITERKKAEEKLMESETRYRILAEQSRTFTWEVDEQGLYTFGDPMVEIILGYRPEEVIYKKHFYDLCPIEEREVFKRGAFGVFKRKEQFVNLENKAITKDGHVVWLSTNGIPILKDDGTLLGYHGSDTDVTERKNKEEEILHISFYDQLTRLYNRRFFEEELKRLDTKRQLPLSFIMGDLNGLKLINDIFGHTEGDRLLKKTAEILKRVCRSDDILARWGGDEFIIILPKTSTADSEEIVQRIKNECKKTNSQKIPLKLSLGTASKTELKQDTQLILIDAESNMYRNKLVEKESLTSSIIFALDQALYEKSNETKEHTDRIHDLAIKLGKSVKLPSSQLDELSLLASLHDIGKVAIPETILLKKGALTEKEWSVIKRHPEIGFNIAHASPQISHIAKSILSCHENWDGSGYPLKIKGESIPVISRIILIADAYDVMTSGRIYKKAMSKNDAIKELKRCAGTQFDPVLVDKFIEIISNS